MTDPRNNPIVLQLVLDSLESKGIPDLTSYPCSQEQFLTIRNEMLMLFAPKQTEDASRTVSAVPK
jgi:hypothetical protein